MKFLLSVNGDLEGARQVALEAGYDGIEYMPRTRIGVPDGQLAPEFPDRGPGITVIHGPKDYYNKDRFEKALRDSIATAQYCGAAAINMHPGSGHQEHGGRENVRQCIEMIKEAEATYDIPIYYEVLSRPRPGNVGDLLQQPYEDPFAWLDDVIEYDLKATLDTTHLASWGADSVKFIERLRNHLRHVHVSGYNFATRQDHRALDEGALPVGGILQELQRRDFDGAITFEPSMDYGRDEEDYTVFARRNREFIRKALA